ncbi:hypothetical protein AB0D08_08990 [Kitasatospora sp. NPDC048540]|uniref:hypothetical protein n=1 Tax=unclassified Kitasatospora TaxID=2633591 RepID=UPI000539FA72|nr:hypothetical protein [Kitasatospora sp. MBT63]
MGEQDKDQDRNRAGARDGGRGQEPRTPAAKAKLVFADPLERQTSDDTDQGWGERPGGGEGSGRGLDWYLSQRPPHHGD